MTLLERSFSPRHGALRLVHLLCRAVVMLGLPFPNPTDIELKEQMKYLDGLTTAASSIPVPNIRPSSQQTAGQQYYEELCMKAVNQCIGRVIRHKNDWAAVLLAGADPSSQLGSARRLMLPMMQSSC